MPTNQQYRWRPAPWRVGASNGGKAAAPAPEETSTEEGGKKKTGTVLLVLVGASAVAFGVMELLGITKVFAPTPTVPAALPPGTAPVPGTTPAPGTVAPAAAPK